MTVGIGSIDKVIAICNNNHNNHNITFGQPCICVVRSTLFVSLNSRTQ